ncbi:MAG: glycosyltransferase [Bacteroidales bacterium]|nr:glycosyltransferase [Bacteroidales bacterium]MDD4603473.1 glycosyltransferase [Bacteroidales bacterium]
MKVLILSCDTGEGHNSAARAFLEYLQTLRIECELIDTLSLVSPAVSQRASDLYVFSTRTSLFKLLYQAGSMISNNKSMSAVYFANKLYSGKLLKYIKVHSYDMIVCTHLFPAEALTSLIRAGELSARTLFIMTDYTCIPFMEETQLDYYIVPHDHLIEECVKRGLPREKLLPYGIPVKQSFYSALSKGDARMECKHLFGERINTDEKWFLMMSGSMGFGNLKCLIQQIIDECEKNIEVFIVCGNNVKLQKNLTAKFSDKENITILGFTDRISTLMDACDVLFTKPGGLSSTEAAAKRIPIIHTDPIPGCETKNAMFFHYHGMSYSSADPHEQVRRALRLCNDQDYRKKMISCQEDNINRDSCKDILNICNK